METAFILFSRYDTTIKPDVEWVRRELEGSGIACLASDTADRSYIYQAQVMIVFQASASWRAMLNDDIHQAKQCGLGLLVITRTTDVYPWPGHGERVRHLAISGLPTAEDRAALVREVRALAQRDAGLTVTVRLFAYAPEQSVLEQIRVVAAQTGEVFPRPTRMDVVTWEEATSSAPRRGDAVVCVFPNELPIRLLVGASTDGSWWDTPETRAVGRRVEGGSDPGGGLVHLKSRAPVAVGFDESLAMLEVEASAVRRVLVAWFGREHQGLASSAFSRTVAFDFPEALRRYLVERVVAKWVSEDEARFAAGRTVQRQKETAISDPFDMADATTLAGRAGFAARSVDLGHYQAPSAPPPVVLAQARFSVYAPSTVQRGREFVLDVWAFNPNLHANVAREASRQGRAHVLGSKGPIAIEIGTTLTVAVEIPSFRVAPPIDAAVWDGMMANTSFVLCADAEATTGAHVGAATLMSGTIPIAVLRFELNIQEKQHEGARELWNRQDRSIKSVFASYASADRVDVLQWARGAEVAGVSVFLDVLSLREASAWETELFRHVPTKDLFCLFWSAPASQSEWVNKEWRCALVTRGLDYIHPVPLVDPRAVPPPDELRSKHFSGVSFVVREYEKGVQGETAGG